MRFSSKHFFGPDLHQFDAATSWSVSVFLVPDLCDVCRIFGVAGHPAAPLCEVVCDERDSRKVGTGVMRCVDEVVHDGFRTLRLCCKARGLRRRKLCSNRRIMLVFYVDVLRCTVRLWVVGMYGMRVAVDFNNAMRAVSIGV